MSPQKRAELARLCAEQPPAKGGKRRVTIAEPAGGKKRASVKESVTEPAKNGARRRTEHNQKAKDETPKKVIQYPPHIISATVRWVLGTKEPKGVYCRFSSLLEQMSTQGRLHRTEGFACSSMNQVKYWLKAHTPTAKDQDSSPMQMLLSAVKKP